MRPPVGGASYKLRKKLWWGLLEGSPEGAVVSKENGGLFERGKTPPGKKVFRAPLQPWSNSFYVNFLPAIIEFSFLPLNFGNCLLNFNACSLSMGKS